MRRFALLLLIPGAVACIENSMEEGGPPASEKVQILTANPEDPSPDKPPNKDTLLAKLANASRYIHHPDTHYFFEHADDKKRVLKTDAVENLTQSKGMVRRVRRMDRGFVISDFHYYYHPNQGTYTLEFEKYGQLLNPESLDHLKAKSYGDWIFADNYGEESTFMHYENGLLNGMSIYFDETLACMHYENGKPMNFSGDFKIDNPLIQMNGEDCQCDTNYTYTGVLYKTWKAHYDSASNGITTYSKFGPVKRGAREVETGLIEAGKIINKTYYIETLDELGGYAWDGTYFLDFVVNKWDEEELTNRWIYASSCEKEERPKKLKSSFLYDEKLYSELPIHSKNAFIKLSSFGSDSWYVETTKYHFNGDYHLPICLVLSDSIEKTGEGLFENYEYYFDLVKGNVFASYLFKRTENIIVFGFYFVSEFENEKVFVHRMNTYTMDGKLIDQLLVDRSYYFKPLRQYFYTDFSIDKDFTIALNRTILEIESSEGDDHSPSQETMLEMLYDTSYEKKPDDFKITDKNHFMERYILTAEGRFKKLE